MNTLNFMYKIKHHMSEIIHKRTKKLEIFHIKFLHSVGAERRMME